MEASKTRVNLTIRPSQGGTVEALLPFMQPGAHVAIGRGLAVIESVNRLPVIELPLCQAHTVKFEAGRLYSFAIEQGCGFCDTSAPIGIASGV